MKDLIRIRNANSEPLTQRARSGFGSLTLFLLWRWTAYFFFLHSIPNFVEGDVIAFFTSDEKIVSLYRTPVSRYRYCVKLVSCHCLSMPSNQVLILGTVPYQRGGTFYLLDNSLLNVYVQEKPVKCLLYPVWLLCMMMWIRIFGFSPSLPREWVK